LIVKVHKAHKVPVWLDHWDIPAGANWQRNIDKAIQDCPTFLIVLSPAAVDSEEVEGELRIALDEHKLVVPVLHRACRIPLRLRSRQYIDFTTAQSLNETLSQLVVDLGGSQTEVVKPPPPIPDKTPSWWSSSHNVFWIVAIPLSVLIGVSLFVSIPRYQPKTTHERAQSPGSTQTATQYSVASSPQESTEKTTKNNQTISGEKTGWCWLGTYNPVRKTWDNTSIDISSGPVVEGKEYRLIYPVNLRDKSTLGSDTLSSRFGEVIGILEEGTTIKVNKIERRDNNKVWAYVSVIKEPSQAGGVATSAPK